MAEELSAEDFIPERPPNDFFHLLVVDDEPVARNLLRSILQAHGYTQIDEAESGEAALESLASNEYHIVLLDKNMPGLDGLEVLERGKAQRPGCEFIMITAYGSMETAIRAMDMGAFSYVTKPFAEVEIIARRVEGALQRVITRYQNEILIDRLRMVVSELDRANAELEKLRNGEDKPADRESELIGRVADAVARLRKLAAGLDLLKKSASGKAAEYIAGLGKGVSAVADMLDAEQNPRAGSAK
jgi:DNA-binding NtrC family response regulator